MSEKSEKPTSKRLREARKKGQIAKSMELTSAIQLSLMVAMLAFLAPDWLADIISVLDLTLRAIRQADDMALQQVFVSCGLLFAKIAGVSGAIVLAGTLGIQFAQVGFTLATESFAQVGQRINPVSNLKQMFSLNSLFELGKSILKLLVVGSIFAVLLYDELTSVQYLSRAGELNALYFSADLLFRLFLGLLSAYIFFAMADYAFQKRRITRQLMMSKEEIKQEFKNAEGNQEIKHQRKELHRELQQSTMKQNVKKSRFILRNPTHIALCVRYDEKTCPLPQILDKAVDRQAREMVRYAEAEGVPMVENISLARRLLKAVPNGQFITPEFYDDLAGIIHFVENMEKSLDRRDTQE